MWPGFKAHYGLGAYALVLGLAGTAAADEGQWPPGQLSDVSGKFTGLGIQLAPKQIWNDSSGLARAAVNLSGCSASFISARGLIATNHHCAYRAIQGQSTPERDLLQDGFIAKTPDAEIAAKGYTVRVLRRITDVTARVNKAARGAKDDLSRYRAILKTKKAIVAECEKKSPDARCEVKSFYLGASYRLFEAVELRDIRLVYAPPKSVGEYGGDIDNWMWPRHSGDFTLFRAYVGKDGRPADHSKDNVAYAPKVHLKIGAQGVAPGDAVMVMGYPRQTNRHLPSAEVTRQIEQFLPGRIDLYGEWLEILAGHAERSKDVAIKVAALKKSLANRHKNARGMLEGIAAIKLRERRAKEDDALKKFAKGKPEHATALRELTALSKARRETYAREQLLRAVSRGVNLVATASDLARLALERKKPDLERSPGYQKRDEPALWRNQQRRLRDFDPEVDAEMLASLVARARALPKGQEVGAFAKLSPGSRDRKTIARGLVGRLKASKLRSLEKVKELFDGEADAIDTFRDPILDLGRALAQELVAQRDIDYQRAGQLSRSGPKFFEALKAVRGGAIYPDANGTLRISLAKVHGYSPRDGLVATPQTSLLGAVAKHTGTWPFNLPKSVIDKAPAAKNSFWSDPGLGTVPICFLSNADTTGGNSGSPMVNGRGELIGLNFDRVWENIAGDFGYSTERSRNIGVDIRYMLWLLDRVEDAGDLLREMGVAEYRSAPARRRRVESAHRPKPIQSEPQPKAPANGCSVGPSPRTRSAAWWALALGVVLQRKRRRGETRTAS